MAVCFSCKIGLRVRVAVTLVVEMNKIDGLKYRELVGLRGKFLTLSDKSDNIMASSEKRGEVDCYTFLLGR